MAGTARSLGGKLALLAALLALLLAGAVAWSGYLAAPELVAQHGASATPPLTTPLHTANGGIGERTPVAVPAPSPSPDAPFTVRITSVAPELLPHLRVRSTTADREQRLMALLQVDAAATLCLAAPAKPQRLVVLTAHGERMLIDPVTDDSKFVPVPGGEVTCAPAQQLAGLQLIDRSGQPRPFALGLGQPATDLELRLVHLLDASSQEHRFFVALGAGPQLCIGREALHADGPIWSLDLRCGTAIAELRLHPSQGMAAVPERLHVTAAGPDYCFLGVKTCTGWVLALEPGDYDLHWLLSGPRLPLASGVHVEAGETRELQVTLPRTHAYRGTITNWEDVLVRDRARMLRIGPVRAHLNEADGSFGLLLTEPLPSVAEIELGRVVAEDWTTEGRRGREIARDEALGTLLVLDTIAERPRLRVHCASQHDGVVRIQVWRHQGTRNVPHSLITAGREVLLRVDDEELLLVAVEKLGRKSWPLVMQAVASTPGEVVLQPGTRLVTVLGGSEGWWFTAIPPGSFGSDEVVPLSAESGTVSLPAGSLGLRASRDGVVRECLFPAAVIDLH